MLLHWYLIATVFIYFRPHRYFKIVQQKLKKILSIGQPVSEEKAELIFSDSDSDRGATDSQLWYEDAFGVVRSKIRNLALDSSGNRWIGMHGAIVSLQLIVHTKYILCPCTHHVHIQISVTSF